MIDQSVAFKLRQATQAQNSVVPTTVGQSNALLNQAIQQATQRIPLSTVAAPNLPPSFDHINPAAQGGFVYPVDRPKYFMVFNIFDYHRESLMSIGSLNSWSRGPPQIVLPLSERLIDNFEGKWNEEPIGFVLGAATDSVMQAIGCNQADQISSEIKGALSSIGGLIQPTQTEQSVISKVGGVLGAATKGFADKLSGLDAKALGSFIPSISAMTGLAPNRFITILYIGPEYKTYQFNWNFSPRSPEESRRLINIINAFKKSAAPTLEYGGLMWGYPCLYEITFMPNPEQLYQFKHCILKRVTTNFTPMGRAGFYHQTQAIEGVQLQLDFWEIEYWTQTSMQGSI